MAFIRTRLLPLLLPLFALALGLSTVHVPRGQEAVWTRGPRAGRHLEPGWHLRLPLVEWVARAPEGTFTCEGEAEEISHEGSARRRAWRVVARVRPEAIPQAARALDPPAPCSGVAPLVARALGSGAASPREALRAALVDAGLEVREDWTGAPAEAPNTQGPPAPAAAPDGRPVLLVALDGADWLAIDPLLQAGLVPNLARLKREGAWAALHSNTPMLSPLLWTTAATGRPPEEHGIVDFLIRDPRTGARVPISSNFRRVKALWNILSASGVASDWVAWWATWPAERIAGHMISDRVAYSLFDTQAGSDESVGATWPPSLRDEIRALRADDVAIGIDEVRRFARVEASDLDRSRRRAAAAGVRQAYADPLLHLTRVLASTATYHRAALRLLEKGQAPLTAVYYQGIDEVSHRFAHCAPPRMELCSDADFLRYRDTVSAFYRYQDFLLGELLERVRPGTVTIVLSDHGFLGGAERPTDVPPDIEGRPGEWHRPYGIFIMHGRDIPAGRTGTVSLYDVAPTVLHLVGLPAGSDMRGTVLAVARAARPSTPARIASWESVGAQRAPAGGAPSSVYDGEVIARLRSLGYIQGPEAEADAAPGAAVSGAAGAAAGAPAAAARGPAGGEEDGAGATLPAAGSAASARLESQELPSSPLGAGGVTYHTNLGALYLSRGEPARAEVEFRRALELRSEHPDAVDGLARALVAQGRGGEARGILERYLELDPDSGGRSWLLYAAACRDAGRSGDGLAFVDRLSRHRAPSCPIQVARSRMLRDRQDPGSAERALRKALEAEPECVEAVEDLFDLYQATRQLERQDALMAQALRARPDSPRVLGLESQRLKARGELAEAERVLRRALNLAPDDPLLLTNLGSLLGISGRFEQAAELLRDVVRRYPTLLEARVNLGAALGKQGHVQEAISVFEEARELGLSSPMLLNALAVAYAQNHQRTDAIRALEHSLNLDRDQPVARSMLDELRQGS